MTTPIDQGRTGRPTRAPIRVLVVDDSDSVRAIIRELIEEDAGLLVCGEARNGREAIGQVLALQPDIVTMDLQMPEMGGMDAIEEIMAVRATPILVVSDVADARNAMSAVERGALDVAPKASLIEGFALAARLKVLAGVPVIRHIRRPRTGLPTPPIPSQPEARPASANQVVAIAASTGGPQALARLLPALPASFPAPILIAQHISDGFAEAMAGWLNELCPLTVSLAREGDAILPGHIYLADSTTHLTLSPERRIRLLQRAEHDIYHPSCDRLLNSVASACASHALGVILTGMGRDGAQGMLAVRNAGGTTIAQDENSSVIFGMNREAIIAGGVQSVCPLAEIAPRLCHLVGLRQSVAPSPTTA